MKTFHPRLILILSSCVIMVITLSHINQLAQATTGAPGESTCSACHINNTPGLTGGSNLTGLPTYVVGGQLYPLTMSIYTSNAIGKTAGFQLNMLNPNGTSNGILTESDPNTVVRPYGTRTYAQHEPAIPFFQGTVWDTAKFHFNWTPSPTNSVVPATSWYSGIIGNGNAATAGGVRGDTAVSGSKSVTIVPQLLGQLNTISGIDCFGESTGALQASATGGLAPISYHWSNGAVTQTISNLPAGTYSASISDVAGQEVVLSIKLGQPAMLAIAEVIDEPLCTGSADGSVRVEVAGGTPPYSYLWQTGATSNSIQNIDAGQYRLTVTDGNQCQELLTYTVDEPDPIEVTLIDIEPQTNTTDGTIIIDVEGGTAPYQFSWEGPNGYTSQNEDLDYLLAGTYSLTVTDAHQCESYFSAEVEFYTANAGAEIVHQQVILAPNPGTTDINISLPFSSPHPWEIEVRSTEGITLMSQTAETNERNVLLDASALPAGLFTITLRNKTEQINTTSTWIKVAR